MSAPISYAALLREIADEDWSDDPTDVVARLCTLASLLPDLERDAALWRAYQASHTEANDGGKA